MIIDGVGTAHLLYDRSSEQVDLNGVDISTYREGNAVVNFEHLSDESGPSAIVGKIIGCKKIFKESDCDDERQLYYFKKLKKTPYLYIKARLFDEAGHKGASELAAMIRDQVMNNEKIIIRWSIEGTTLGRKDNVITSCALKRIALTVKPCLNNTETGVISDPMGAPQNSPQKSTPTSLLDLQDNKKSEMDADGNSRIGDPFEVEMYVEDDQARLLTSLKMLAKLKVVSKALSLGGAGAAPGALTGGAALQKESLITDEEALRRNKALALAALRDYDPSNGFNKAEFKEILKNKLTEPSEEFIDNFVDMVDKIKVKLNKAEQLENKFEYFEIELKKALDDYSPPKDHVNFNNKKMKLGKATTNEGKYSLLYEDDCCYTAVPEGNDNWEFDDMLRLPKSKEGKHYKVESKPKLNIKDDYYTYSKGDK